jgi:hypothetical protein
MIDELEAVERYRNDTAPPTMEARARARSALDGAISAEAAHLHRRPRGWRRPQRPAMVRLAAVGLVAATMAGVLAIAHALPGTGGPGGSLPGDLRRAILIAYESESGSILYVHQTRTASNGSDYVSDMWSSLTVTQGGEQVTTRTRFEDASGTAVQDFQITYVIPPTTGSFTPMGNVTDVDYLTKTWYTQLNGPEPAPPGSTPDSILVGSLSNRIANGQWSDLGATTVDGQPAIKLSQVNPPGLQSLTVWVDATTYLPFQEMLTYSTADGGQTVNGNVTSTLGYLPSTATNRADLKVTIPAGFSQTTPPN